MFHVGHDFLKQIQDITIQNGDWNIKRSNFLTLKAINSQIAELNYDGVGLNKDDKVENTKFPPFLQVFYYLIYQRKQIPTQELFFSEYLKWLQVPFSDNKTFIFNNETYNTEGLKARAYRAYPSLIRDVHFYYYLLESAQFDEVNYSLRNDYFEGIDIILRKQDKSIGLSILINTQRGSEYKKIKLNRHAYDSSLNEIVLKVSFRDLYKTGNIYLLGEKQLEEINLEFQKV